MNFDIDIDIENMKIAVIDNYDSFTYNLVHYLDDLGAEVTVFRNDEFELKELEPLLKPTSAAESDIK